MKIRNFYAHTLESTSFNIYSLEGMGDKMEKIK